VRRIDRDLPHLLFDRSAGIARADESAATTARSRPSRTPTRASAPGCGISLHPRL